MKFPVYRKYSNNRSYFKILSHNAFEEIQLVGQKAVKYTHAVSNFVDRNLLNDMLICHEERWVIISEKDYETISQV
ncbi:hypothetical protein N9M27_03045 [Flavobacteriales bacterium]|nr:hypothetical protein [Flavobacteriales bacterium]